jgi:alpha/beta hydrolase fold
MTITTNSTGWIGELSKTRKVIAVEMQGHGRTADINRDFSYENLADDIAAMLDYLKIKQADLLGYSMGGGVAMQVAIRHPEKVRRVVSISAVFRHDGLVKEALDAFPRLTADTFKGSPIETEYKKLSPTPNEFPNFVKRVVAMALKSYDFGASKLKATKAPFFFIHGDADGVRLDHISEMFRLKGDEMMGDLRPRSESRLAVLPNTTEAKDVVHRSSSIAASVWSVVGLSAVEPAQVSQSRPVVIVALLPDFDATHRARPGAAWKPSYSRWGSRPSLTWASVTIRRSMRWQHSVERGCTSTAARTS